MNKCLISFISIVLLVSWAGLSNAETPSRTVETATKYLATEQFDSVISALEPWIDEHPDVIAYYVLGYALYEKGRHDEAIEMFEAGYLLDPGFSPSTIEGLPWIAELEVKVKRGVRPAKSPGVVPLLNRNEMTPSENPQS